MIDPRGMTLREWADRVVLVVPSSWAFGNLASEADWQTWAVGLVRAGGFSQRNLPDPYAFADWRKWAERVYPMLEVSA